MARLMPQKALNGLVAHLDEVDHALHSKAKEVEARAKANLAAARASTTHTRIDQSGAHQTTIGMGHTEGQYGSIDYEVYMEGQDPMATEFGHGPSGFFAPDKHGKHTKAPHGLYILTSAAGFEGLSFTPSSGRRAGKR